MLNGTKQNGAKKCDPILQAQKAAAELGHTIGQFRNNKKEGAPDKDGVATASCSRCLCLVVLKEGRAFGTVLETQCDPGFVDKNIEFKHEPMSDEHMKLISGPWQHPAKPLKKA